VSKFDINPGDLIVWRCTYYPEHDVYDDDTLYSTIENDWVPIGRNFVHMCISYDDKTYSWLNEKGLFRARVDDKAASKYKIAVKRVTVHRLGESTLALNGNGKHQR